jgi:hypothetical protein
MMKAIVAVRGLRSFMCVCLCVSAVTAASSVRPSESNTHLRPHPVDVSISADKSHMIERMKSHAGRGYLPCPNVRNFATSNADIASGDEPCGVAIRRPNTLSIGAW